MSLAEGSIPETGDKRGLQKPMQLSHVALVSAPIVLAALSLSGAYVIRKVMSVRAPYWDGLLSVAGWIGALWGITCVCWIIIAAIIGFELIMRRIDTQMPPGYKDTEDILFANGLGNLWWLIVILALDMAVALVLRRTEGQEAHS